MRRGMEKEGVYKTRCPVALILELKKNKSTIREVIMNVVSHDERLGTAFSAVYEDLIARKTLPGTLVFQVFPTAWNITTQGCGFSANIGEGRDRGERVLFVQARKPQAENVTAAEKYIFRYGETVKISFLISYYLLAARELLSVPELLAKYPDLAVADRMNLKEAMDGLDYYLRS